MKQVSSAFWQSYANGKFKNISDFVAGRSLHIHQNDAKVDTFARFLGSAFDGKPSQTLVCPSSFRRSSLLEKFGLPDWGGTSSSLRIFTASYVEYYRRLEIPLFPTCVSANSVSFKHERFSSLSSSEKSFLSVGAFAALDQFNLFKCSFDPSSLTFLDATFGPFPYPSGPRTPRYLLKELRQLHL